MPDFSSLPWWQRPPFAATVEERRYRRRSRNHDYQRPNRRYMITITASPLLLPLSRVFLSSTGLPVAEPTETGECFVGAFADWCGLYTKQIEAGPYVVMPDHVHFCLSTISPLDTKFSSVIGRLMGMATNRLHDLLGQNPQIYRMLTDNALKRLRAHSEAEWGRAISNGDTIIPIEDIRFFSRGYTDSIALSDRRWRNQLNYVEDNPRRLLFKRRFPEYFRERWQIKIGEDRFVAVGNVLLLKKPQLEVVRYSSKFSPEKNSENSRRWSDCIASGGVLVSPFIHPAERMAKEKAMAEGGYVIKICDTGFCERYVPSGKEFELMAEGRLLLMSDKPYEPGQKAMRRARALELNDLAELVASLPWQDKESGSRISPLRSRHRLRSSHSLRSRHRLRSPHSLRSRHRLRSSHSLSSRHRLRIPHSLRSRHRLRSPHSLRSRHRLRTAEDRQGLGDFGLLKFYYFGAELEGFEYFLLILRYILRMVCIGGKR